jgi:hypothetical protein
LGRRFRITPLGPRRRLAEEVMLKRLEIPRLASANGPAEAEPTLEQCDYAACRRACRAAADAARRDRVRHARFQELAAVAGPLAEAFAADSGLRVHLNSARAAARLTTAAVLGDAVAPPADVLFFLAGGEVRAAVLGPPLRAVVDRLEAVGPCTPARWLRTYRRASRDDFVVACRALADVGLAAFG